MMTLVLILVLLTLVAGCLFFLLTDKTSTNKRIAAVRGTPAKQASVENIIAGRRKNVEAVLKGQDKKDKNSGKKETLSVRQRLDRAGFSEVPTRYFWILSAVLGAGFCIVSLVKGYPPLVPILGTFAAGFGLPRWILGFLQKRREKKFTADFANAIDVIVRSVRSGFPVSEALKVVAYEFREPVSTEFRRLVEGLKVGLSMDQGLRRMYESMPTQEVAFFGIVMGVQQKSGGNLAETLSNLAAVLRDRKRLTDKIKAMSSEAKASAMIIGSLPPVVMTLVYLTSPDYIMLLFTEKMGNILLGICVFWMGVGIFTMRSMINFKH